MRILRTQLLTVPLLFALCSASALASSLYVSDLSLDTVQVFDATTGALTGSLTPTGGFESPGGIAVASNGNIYVADTGANVVDEFSPSGTFLGTVVSSGLVEPTGLAFGPGGNLYVANFGVNNESYVAEFNASGTPINLAFVPSSTGLYDPEAIAFGPDGDLYIADSSRDAVDQVLVPSGTFNTLIPAGVPARPSRTLPVSPSAPTAIYLLPMRASAATQPALAYINTPPVERLWEPSAPRTFCPLPSTWRSDRTGTST